RVAASGSHRDARTEGFMRRMGEIEPGGVGSALKFCWLAEGQMDVYTPFGPTSEWATLAGQAALEAAGGAVLHPHADGGRGRPPRRCWRPPVARCSTRMPTAGAGDRCATTSATPSSTATSSPSATRRCPGAPGSACKGGDVTEHERDDIARLLEIMARLRDP